MAEGWTATELAGFLTEHPFFSLLTAPLRRWLAGRVTVVAARAGETVLRQGADADAVYLVLSGRLELVAVGEGGARVTGTVGPRGSIGEIGVLTGEPHPVSARAVRDCELLVVDRALVVSLVAESRSFSAALLTFLGTILAETEGAQAGLSVKRNVLALVSADGGANAWLTDELLAQLGRWGSVAVLDGPGAGEDPAAGGRRLGALEERADVVVLLAGGEDRSWTDFCVRQADRVIVVAGARPDPGSLPDGLDGCDLAFAGRSLAPGVRRRWCDLLRPHARYNVADPAAVAAMARRLSGRSVGLVLSGGGARGLAHVGVLAALQERGIPIDRIGGTSMGAFVGALAASGRDAGEIRELLHRELVERKPFNDYTFPAVSLARGRRARAMMDRLFALSTIEELPLDFYCITADLVAGEEVVQREDEVWLHVGASMSIPGWAPPMPCGPRILVDGGLLNNFPIDVMRAAEEGPIIGVDAMGMSRSGSGTADEPRLPNLGEILAGATTLGSRRRAEANAEMAALVVRPDVGAIGLMDFAQLDRLIAIGREDTLAALDAAPLDAAPLDAGLLGAV